VETECVVEACDGIADTPSAATTVTRGRSANFGASIFIVAAFL
jgi:hypothetical protein